MNGLNRSLPDALSDAFPPEDAPDSEAGSDGGDQASPWSPAWEDWRLPDEAAGAAYEATPPERRAFVKATLALVQSFHAEQPALSEERAENAASGYGRIVRRTPAPWTLLLFGPGTSPVRLAAAIMPAHLAGVRHIPAVWTGGPGAVPADLAAALELSGIEYVFAPPPASAGHLSGLLSHPRGQGGRGRVLLFPGADAFARPEISGWSDIPVWKERPVRRIGAMPGARLDRRTLLWAHPGSEIIPWKDEKNAAAPDVVFGHPDHAPPRPSFMLEPGMEGLWTHPELSPAFFLNSETTIFRCQALPFRA